MNLSELKNLCCKALNGSDYTSFQHTVSPARVIGLIERLDQLRHAAIEVAYINHVECPHCQEALTRLKKEINKSDDV